MSRTAAQLVAEARNRIREVEAATFDADDMHALVIDVREPAEYALGHLPHAINIPRGTLEFQIDSHPALVPAPGMPAERSRVLMLYCQQGGRAALAADTLQNMGFSSVFSLGGGFDAWVQTGQGMER